MKVLKLSPKGRVKARNIAIAVRCRNWAHVKELAASIEPGATALVLELVARILHRRPDDVDVLVSQLKLVPETANTVVHRTIASTAPVGYVTWPRRWEPAA